MVMSTRVQKLLTMITAIKRTIRYASASADPLTRTFCGRFVDHIIKPDLLNGLFSQMWGRSLGLSEAVSWRFCQLVRGHRGWPVDILFMVTFKWLQKRLSHAFFILLRIHMLTSCLFIHHNIQHKIYSSYALFICPLTSQK